MSSFFCFYKICCCSVVIRGKSTLELFLFLKLFLFVLLYSLLGELCCVLEIRFLSVWRLC